MFLIKFFQQTNYHIVSGRINGPVVQLDRISDFGSEGWGFESSLGHGLFPRIIFYFWEYFFEYISLITLKKSELLYVWVTRFFFKFNELMKDVRKILSPLNSYYLQIQQENLK